MAFMNMRKIFKSDEEAHGEDKKRIIAAVYGADDFALDFAISRTQGDLEIDFARKMFALTCSAFNITSIDPPFVQVSDPELIY